MKTMKSQYVEAAMTKGIFCFNHPTVFNQWEAKDAAQADKWDAHSVYNATHLMYAPIIGEENGMPKYGEVKPLAEKAIVRLQSNAVKHSPICCFRAITEEDVSFEGENTIISLDNCVGRIMDEFHHDAYIIVLAAPFVERLKSKYTVPYSGNVIYKNTLNDYDFMVPESAKETVEQLFRKDERFAWQKEYRFVLQPSEKGPVFVELGSIEDIAQSGKLADLRT